MPGDHSQSPFVPISPNPFIVGNPVRDPRMFFGREAEFELIRKRFKDSAAEGGLIVLCGERRSGKTSILFQIMNGRLGPEFVPVLIDMQSMAIESENDFLTKVATEIAAAVEKTAGPEPAADLTEHLARLLQAADAAREPGAQAPASKADAFCRFVRLVLRLDPARKLIILFDEYELFETKIDAGTLTRGVFDVLAHLIENEPVFLIFTGSLNLEERRREYWQRFLPKSHYKTISFLEKSDAVRLITEPVAGRVHYGDGVVETIFRLTAGQPFYTQAVCQNLVDYLNEHRTRTVELDAVRSVVASIVSNPFPQMIYLWDGLGSDEKKALALLGEVLPDVTTYGTVRHLTRAIGRNRYPLRPDEGPLATALEDLFRREILLKDDRQPPGYAFKMDLWRHWIRRMHSVWQVLRELKIPYQKQQRPGWLAAAGAAVVVLVAVVVWLFTRTPAATGPTPRPPGAVTALFRVEALPAGAMIEPDGQAPRVGTFEAWMSPGEHRFRVFAPGYRDTTLRLVAQAGDSATTGVRLLPRLGAATIRTEPPGARIIVDRVDRGPSPRTVSGLAVPSPHTVVAELEGYESARDSFRVQADTTVVLPPLKLAGTTTLLSVTTTPPGALITVNGALAGKSNRNVPVSSARPQRIRLSLDGYVPQDTVMSVIGSTGSLEVTLQELPGGILTIRGTALLATEIRIDGVLVFGGETFNSGPKRVRPGRRGIAISFQSQPAVADSVDVGPGEKVVYDWDKKTVVSRGGP